MEKNYSYEMEKIIKSEYKKKGFSKKIRSELELLVRDIKDTNKMTLMYKYKYSIFNNAIKRSNLESVYIKLFNKIRNYEMINEYNYFSNNIYTTIFGNMEVVYNEFGINFINKVVDKYVNTNDKEKEKLLEKLFIGVYRTEDVEYINMILNKIDNIKNVHVIDTILYTLGHDYLEVDYIKKNKEELLNIVLLSNSEFNSKILKEYMKLIANDRINSNDYIEKYKLFASEENKELLDACYKLIETNTLKKYNYFLQNKCINTLLEISKTKNNLKPYSEVILNVVCKCKDCFIQEYLLDKIKTIKNEKSLELIIAVSPLLNKYSNRFEIIRVINSLEDENKNLTKKLVINLDKE